MFSLQELFVIWFYCMNNKIKNIQNELKQLSNKRIAEHSQKFFKTGKGEYGEGDKFLGIRVPLLRQLAKKHKDISIKEASLLLKSQFHEERLLSLFLLIGLYRISANQEKKKIYNLYLSNTQFINNWDLIDSSAEHIVGAFLWEINKKPIYVLARSRNLWERRISIMATFYFIKRNSFKDTLKLAKILLSDNEDLIHKSVGWMLREIGKRDLETEEEFLKKHYKKMPRTMLRYAIERLSKGKREKYLKKGGNR